MNKFKQILAIAVMATLYTVQINATKAAATLPITKADASTKIAASEITLATGTNKAKPEDTQKKNTSDKTKSTKTVRNFLIGSTVVTAATILSIAAFVFLKPENTFSKFVKTNGFTQAVINAWNNIVKSDKAPVTPKREKAIISEYVKNFDTCETAFAGLKKECSPAHTNAEQKCKTAGILDKCQDAMEPIFEKERKELYAQDAIKLAIANEALAVKCEKQGCFGINDQENFCRKDGCRDDAIRNIYKQKREFKRNQKDLEQKAKDLARIETQKQIDAAYKACHAPIIETENCKKAHWTIKETNGCQATYDDQANKKEENCHNHRILKAIRGY